jgi:hypothetical protein
MKDEEFALGEMVMMSEDDFEGMSEDLNYWVAAASMLGSLLIAHEIEFELTEEAVAEYIESEMI